VILVQIRCKVCRRLLDEVVSAPASSDEQRWTHWVSVQICQRHGDGAGHGNIRVWQERQRRAGKPTERVVERMWICWADLRPKVEKARRDGRPGEHLI
jgi:hypothetical protein